MLTRSAITTRIIPCTQTRPTRIKATTAGKMSVTISEPMECNERLDAHRQALQALCRKMGWSDFYMPAALANGDYVWVSVGEILPTLNRVYAALNTAPRFKVPSLATDSYEIAAELNLLLRELEK